MSTITPRTTTSQTATTGNPRADTRSAAPERELWIDALRAGALLVVVLGHWLMAAVTLRGSGADTDLGFSNILEVSTVTHLLTWPLQVMPVFFAAGAYVVARKHQAVPDGDRARGGVGRQGWSAHMADRTRQLIVPTLPLLTLWWLATPALAEAFGVDTVRAAGGAALVPLWFLSAYLLVQSMTPALIRLVERFGVIRPVLVCLATTFVIDTAHHAYGLTGVGFANFATVWAIPTLLGIGLALRGYTTRALLVGALLSFVGAVALIQAAGYVIPVVGAAAVEGRGNTSPPSTVLALHGVTYTCLALCVGPRIERWLGASARRRAVLRRAAALSMPVYLWHMTALVVLVALIMLTASRGVAVPGIAELMALEPLSAVWWATRPLWIALNVAATLLVLTLIRRPTGWLVAIDRRVVVTDGLPTSWTAAAVALAVVGIGMIVSSPQPVPALGGALVIGSLALPIVWRR